MAARINKGLPYDYGSIMHYGLYTFSNDIKNYKNTISLRGKTAKPTPGQRRGLSIFDIQWLYEFYC